MAKFSDRLKMLRKEHQLSQHDLAIQLGCVSKSSINMYERGEREPNFVTLEAIADYFNVDMDYLLGKSDYPNKYSELLNDLRNDSKEGRTQAKEDMYRTFGTDHATASTRVLGDNLVAVLYYRAMNPYAAAELLDLIDAVDGMDYQKLGDIRLMVRAYLRSTDAIREIVDTALKPYREEQEEADWTG